MAKRRNHEFITKRLTELGATEVSIALPHGQPKQEIVRHAATGDFSLVVMGHPVAEQLGGLDRDGPAHGMADENDRIQVEMGDHGLDVFGQHFEGPSPVDEIGIFDEAAVRCQP